MTGVSKRGRLGEGRPRLGTGETVRVYLVAPAESVSAWRARADEDGVDLSEWIRDELDLAASRKGK